MTGLLALNVVILIYFAVLNILYLVLIIVAFRRMRTYVRRLRPVHIDDLVSASEGLSMSLLVPAYNEAEMIIDSVRSLLTLRYPDYEIIIINDGSTDATLVRLISAFELRRIERVATCSVATQPVGQVYQSRRHPNLYVVDKENGGKADALNAGLNYSRGAIISALDADTLLEPDALARLVRPFLEDSTTVAVGGIIRIVNGCRVEELSFRRYRRFSDLLRVLGLALIESFGYRQLTTFWRLRGLVSAMRGDTSWGEMERTGFNNAASRAQARVS